MTFAVSFNSFGQGRQLRKADTAYEQYEFAKAMDYYKRAYSKSSDKVQKIAMSFRMAECARKIGNYRQAESYYKRTIKMRYDDPIAIYYLGMMQRNIASNKTAEKAVSKYNEAIKSFQQYHEKVPFVKQLMDNVMQRAQSRGQIRTLLGRLCRFHLWEPNMFGMHKALPHDAALMEHGPGIRRAFTYKALNKLIQGSAADMTKKSMVALYENGIIPHIQIHDEVDISVESPKKAEEIISIMESAVELKVPNKVDYEQGENWGDIK